MKTNKKYASVFELNGVPKFSQAFPLALQHVVAMIVGCVTPAIVIAGMAGLNGGDKVIFVQTALFIAAISTLVQLFPLGGKIGSGLPVIIAYLPSMQAIVEGYDIATILGAQLIGGIVAVFVGIFVKKLRVLFPPLITGTVVFTIGLSLYPTAVKYMAGGASSPEYGSWQNWLVGFITLAVVIGLCKRCLEAIFHSDRYDRGICDICFLWYGGFLFRGKLRDVPGSPPAVFRYEIRTVCNHYDGSVICN